VRRRRGRWFRGWGLALAGAIGSSPGAAQGPALDITPAEIRPGELLSVEVRGEPRRPALILLSREDGGGSLAGRALGVGPDFAPIPVGMLDASGSLRLMVRIPADLPGGRYFLQAVTSADGRLGPSASLGEARRVDVIVGAAPPVAEGARRGAVIGLVYDAARGTPLAGARVSLEGGGEAVTRADGAFFFLDVSPGSRRVAATAAGLAPASQEVSVAAGAAAGAILGLSPPNLAIPPALPPPFPPALFGTVSEAGSGRAIGDLRVFLTTAPDRPSISSTGQFIFIGAPTGSHALTAAAFGFVNVSAGVTLAPNAVATRHLQLAPRPLGAVETVPAGAGLGGMAVDPGTDAAVAIRADGSVVAVHLRTGQTLASVPALEPLGTRPGAPPSPEFFRAQVGIVPDASLAAVTDSITPFLGTPARRGTLAVVDLAARRLAGRVDLGTSAPVGIPAGSAAVDPRGRRLAVHAATRQAAVAVLTKRAPLQTTITVVALDTLATRTIRLDGWYRSLDFDASGRRLIAGALVPMPAAPFEFAPVLDGIIVTEAMAEVDIASGAVARTLPLFEALPLTVRFVLEEVAVVPGTTRLVLTGQENRPNGSALIATLDLATGRGSAPAALTGGQFADRLVLDPPRNRAAVLTVAIGGPPMIFVVDLESLRVLRAFEDPTVGAVGLAVDPSDGTLVRSGDPRRLFLLRPLEQPVPRPTGRLTVEVLAGGTPVPGATIVLERAGVVALTFPDGRVSLGAVPVGPQPVTVSAPGFEPATLTATIVEGRETSQGVSLLPSTGTGEVQGQVLALAGGGSPLLRAQAGSRTLEPVPGALVSIPGTGLQVVTARDGTFRLAGVPLGTYLLGAAAPGLVTLPELVRVARDAVAQLTLILARTLGR
jgi:hypothetical protein